MTETTPAPQTVGESPEDAEVEAPIPEEIEEGLIAGRPVRKVIGDLSDTQRVLVGLDLGPRR